mmetsp:Transcript_26317/g.75044  ORF Transcript_26317/g.75044 Transcript_26317/m.75044 type:complete len:243 (-) Transcript_26317:4202-4930(-)
MGSRANGARHARRRDLHAGRPGLPAGRISWHRVPRLLCDDVRQGGQADAARAAEAHHPGAAVEASAGLLLLLDQGAQRVGVPRAVFPPGHGLLGAGGHLEGEAGGAARGAPEQHPAGERQVRGAAGGYVEHDTRSAGSEQEAIEASAGGAAGGREVRPVAGARPGVPLHPVRRFLALVRPERGGAGERQGGQGHPDRAAAGAERGPDEPADRARGAGDDDAAAAPDEREGPERDQGDYRAGG